MFEKRERGGEERGHRSKKIHVRSKDPSRIARQFEKGSSKEKRNLKNGRGGVSNSYDSQIHIAVANVFCGSGISFLFSKSDSGVSHSTINEINVKSVNPYMLFHSR